MRIRSRDYRPRDDAEYVHSLDAPRRYFSRLMASLQSIRPAIPAWQRSCNSSAPPHPHELEYVQHGSRNDKTEQAASPRRMRANTCDII